MRQLTLAISAVIVTAAFASFTLLFAVPEARSQDRTAESQYATEDSTFSDTTSQEVTQETPPPGETSFDGTSISQSTVDTTVDTRMVSEGSASGGRAPREQRSIMQPTEPYSQVVDNTLPGRFSAQGWQQSSEGSLYYGEDYNYAEPSDGAAPAQFKVDIPTTDYYTVYARWPSQKGSSAATRFGISTASGIEWTRVDQRRDEGMWIRLGAYEMEAGDSYAVQVAPSSKDGGRVLADAVAVVRGTQVPPPDGRAASSTSGESTFTAAGGGHTGRDVVRVARKHLGTKYRLSPPYPCKAYEKEDCSCHTKVVFRRFDRRLPDDPVKQWKYGRRVNKSNLRPGDLVFFKEGGSRVITHVAIYSGSGDIVHASSYWGKVVERPMKYVDGYYGAKRLKPR